MRREIPYKYIEDEEGIPYHWVEMGKGPNTVLINGMASDAIRIFPLIEVMGQKGFRVICLDHYNHSRSKGYAKEPMTLQEMANYHADFLNLYKQPIHYLVGFSLGSLIIPLMLDRLKYKPDKVILYAPPIGEDSLKLPGYAQKLKKNVQRSRVHRYIFTRLAGFVVRRERLMKTIIRRFLAGPIPDDERDDVLTVQYYLWNITTFRQWWQIFIEVIERSKSIFEENQHKLESLDVTIIYPQNDNHINSQLAKERFERLLPNSEMVFIPDIKHAPSGDLTHEFVESLVEKLKPYLKPA